MKKKQIFTVRASRCDPLPRKGIHFDALGKLIDFNIENGTSAIIICGTTGESATMSDEEHVEAIRFAVEHTAGRVPVVAGAGSNDTSYAVWLAREAEDLGADGLLCVTPYYNKATQRGLVRHFFAVADAVKIPIIVYNVPSRTGLGIAPETYAELSRHERIVATKEACGNIAEIARTRACAGTISPCIRETTPRSCPSSLWAASGSSRFWRTSCRGRRATSAAFILKTGPPKAAPCSSGSPS
jgi:4-hydroxy-tetrahydrodipicolinate synthase